MRAFLVGGSAWAAFVLLGCGGKFQVAPGDGGPVQDSAAIVDSSPPLPDTSPVVSETSTPEPATCAGVCAHFAAEGCADPNCESNCEQLQIDCAGSGYITTFQALLQCAATAEPITCVNGQPHSTACASLTDMVGADCVAQSPDAGGDSICSAQTSGVSCMQCCEMAHPSGVMAYLNVFVPCECDPANGACAGPCASEICAQPLTYPQPDDACDQCVAQSLGVGGACWYRITNDCGQDVACQAMEACLATWCANKP